MPMSVQERNRIYHHGYKPLEPEFWKRVFEQPWLVQNDIFTDTISLHSRAIENTEALVYIPGYLGNETFLSLDQVKELKIPALATYMKVRASLPLDEGDTDEWAIVRQQASLERWLHKNTIVAGFGTRVPLLPYTDHLGNWLALDRNQMLASYGIEVVCVPRGVPHAEVFGERLHWLNGVKALVRLWPRQSLKYPGLVTVDPHPMNPPYASDRSVAAKPGKLLNRTIWSNSGMGEPSRNGKHLAAFANIMTDPKMTAELKFAKSAKEIVDVYTRGPRSCMSYKASDFESPIHPCHVYGLDPAIAVAYLEALGGRITARCLVNLDKKEWPSIYGDIERMKALLEPMGYQRNFYALEGCYLEAIEHEGRYIAPYVDGAADHADYRDGKLWMGPSGSYFLASSTEGFAEDAIERVYCHGCETPMEEGDSTYFQGDDYCDSCFGEIVMISDVSGEYIHRDNAVSVLCRDGNELWMSEDEAENQNVEFIDQLGTYVGEDHPDHSSNQIKEAV